LCTQESTTAKAYSVVTGTSLADGLLPMRSQESQVGSTVIAYAGVAGKLLRMQTQESQMGLLYPSIVR
jgi:hypothetical protein